MNTFKLKPRLSFHFETGLDDIAQTIYIQKSWNDPNCILYIVMEINEKLYN